MTRGWCPWMAALAALAGVSRDEARAVTPACTLGTAACPLHISLVLGRGRGLADGEAAVLVSRGPENSTGSPRRYPTLTAKRKSADHPRPQLSGGLGYALASPPERREACHEG